MSRFRPTKELVPLLCSTRFDEGAVRALIEAQGPTAWTFADDFWVLVSHALGDAPGRDRAIAEALCRAVDLDDARASSFEDLFAPLAFCARGLGSQPDAHSSLSISTLSAVLRRLDHVTHDLLWDAVRVLAFGEEDGLGTLRARLVPDRGFAQGIGCDGIADERAYALLRPDGWTDADEILALAIDHAPQGPATTGARATARRLGIELERDGLTCDAGGRLDVDPYDAAPLLELARKQGERGLFAKVAKALVQSNPGYLLEPCSPESHAYAANVETVGEAWRVGEVLVTRLGRRTARPRLTVKPFRDAAMADVAFEAFVATKLAPLGGTSGGPPRPDSSLHEACERAHRPSAWLHLTHGADASAVDERGRTPLHVCADPEIARWLLARGTRVDARTPEGLTPLATCSGIFDGGTAARMAQVLLDHGADPRDASSPLCSHAARGHLRACRALIAAGAHLDQTLDGRSALVWAQQAAEERRPAAWWGLRAGPDAMT